MTGVRAIVALLAGLSLASMAHGQEHQHDHGAMSGAPPALLGSIAFEISCKPEVRGEFNRAVGLLHSFWYNEAELAFDRVAVADPDCAIAYWGQAMTGYPQVNGWPGPAQLAAARRALAAADQAATKTPRELAYVQALHVFFDDFTEARALAQAKRYADAMGTLAARYPRDVEAQAFHALALIAPGSADDVKLVVPRQAVAILEPLFRRYPDHPGIAHYIIHAADNPRMARAALDAARRYAQIAPSAPHALHMPSHIFARLGLWQDDIRSNLASKAAAEVTTGERVGAENRLHAMEFLVYAYLQAGQDDDARAIVAEARTVQAADVDPRFPNYFATVQARFGALLAIETQDWSKAAALVPAPGTSDFGQLQTLLANAVAAGHVHDVLSADSIARRLDAIYGNAPALEPGSAGATPRDEVRAWLAFARGELERAVDLLRPIALRQEQTGKGEVELPAREMIADMYLSEGHPREALREYAASLRSDPQRFNALAGAASAAAQLGMRSLERSYSQRLVRNCEGATGTPREALRRARTIGRGPLSGWTAVGSPACR